MKGRRRATNSSAAGDDGSIAGAVFGLLCLSVANGQTKLSYTIDQPRLAAAAQIYDLSSAVSYGVLHKLCRPD